MDALINSGRRNLAMYAGHQALEKIFKSLLAASDKPRKYTHKIVQLAELCGYDLTPEQLSELSEIDGFYIVAKYSSVKSAFQQRCTAEYVSYWSEIIKKWQNAICKQAITVRASLSENEVATHPEETFLM
jgi:HEPN domain-containing protein